MRSKAVCFGNTGTNHTNEMEFIEVTNSGEKFGCPTCGVVIHR